MNSIGLTALRERLANGERIFLLDVREPEEHEAHDIGGELYPLGELMQHAANIPRDIPVVVYCKRGIRSQIAIQRLEEKLGLTNLLNLEGGIGER